MPSRPWAGGRRMVGDLARLIAHAAANGGHGNDRPTEVVHVATQSRPYPYALPLRRRADRGALLPGVLVDRTVGVILDLIGTNPDFRLLRDAFV